MKQNPRLFSLLYFFFLFPFACKSPQPDEKNDIKDDPIKIVGTMKEVMWKGELGPKIKLDTLTNKRGLIALAPESFLSGEIMVLDGKPFVARVVNDSTMKVTSTFAVGAPFMVYSNVTSWSEPILDLEFTSVTDIEEWLNTYILATDKPFPFKIKGVVNSAKIHVQDLPEGAVVNSPKEAHQGQVDFKLGRQAVEVAGFYSQNHQGIFTHHDSYLHMHLITADHQKMGHLDEVEFSSLKLYLPDNIEVKTVVKTSGIELVVLGNLQDAGMPHIACTKSCCAPYFESGKQAGKVVSLGLVDPKSQKTWLFEATPDISRQLEILSRHTTSSSSSSSSSLSAIFLTHAHIGHYTGLMYFGREAMGADSVPVFAMPQMHQFLSQHGPWSQLVELGNIDLMRINEQELIMLTDELSVEAFLVPHRDEFSETVGYKISGPNKSALFIPDIDKWEKWDQDIIEEIKQVDYAFLDATFYSADELPNRDLAEIPHPTVEESMDLFQGLSKEEKARVHFIHFNHSNPLVDAESEEAKLVIEKGFCLAREGMKVEL